jgi:hypothetical protein
LAFLKFSLPDFAITTQIINMYNNYSKCAIRISILIFQGVDCCFPFVFNTFLHIRMNYLGHKDTTFCLNCDFFDSVDFFAPTVAPT